MKTITARMAIYENEGKFETTQRRAIYIDVSGLQKNRAEEYIKNMMAKCGMEFYANAMRAGEIPCRVEA